MGADTGGLDWIFVELTKGTFVGVIDAVCVDCVVGNVDLVVGSVCAVQSKPSSG